MSRFRVGDSVRRKLALAAVTAATLMAALSVEPAPGAPVAYSSAAKSPQGKPALRIDEITPSVADRGELVTISGGGFGAHNLVVTVGGDPVELVAATGSRASFRVPLLGAVGNVFVEARNPGEITGRIGLYVRFDGNTVAVEDAAAAVAAPIGAEGGAITVEGMTLAIPAGAVPEGTTITATPLRSLTGSPFAAAPVGLKLEPSGLVLLQPATLTLPKPTGAGTVVGFGFNGDGDGFHLVPVSVSGDSVQLKVWHFSGAGTLTASLDEIEAVLSYEPTPAHELAEQRIAAALVDAQVNGSDPGPAIARALRDWRSSSVSQGLQIAGTTTRLDFFELAFGEWLAWLAYLQEYRDTIPAADASFFDTASALDRGTATNSAAAVARRQLERCLGPDLPRAALRNVLRVASAVNLAGLPIEETETSGGERPLPSGRDLPAACVDVEIVAVLHPAVFARNRDNSFSARAQAVFWAGDPSTSIPLRYRLADTTDGPPLPLASATGTDGFATTLHPTALGSRALELTVDFGPDSVLRALFHRRDLTVPVRERLELQALTPTTIGAGSSVSLRLRAAGDGMVGAVVPLTVGGPGTVTPTTATTNTQGEATAVYTAPADTLVTSAAVTATLADGTSATVTIEIAPFVVVGVSPVSATLNPGESVNLTATVTGTFVTAVTWTATGGEVVSTGTNTARYTAGTTAGTFSVTATSTADSAATASATITINAGRRGVTRLADTFGRIHAIASDGSVFRCGFDTRFSTATAWADSVSCTQAAGSSDARVDFAETYAGDELVEVVAEGAASSAGLARGESGYVLQFQVTRPTDVVVTADVAAGSCESRVLLIGASGFLVFDLDGGRVDQRFTLVPGTHQAGVGVVCSGDEGMARFALRLQFA
ncbi:MAG TPA: hypothetical protein VM184_01730 [Gaiellaceae bacterium]|nr:hypothetical protein [Gaiellaceae bacterium]